MSGGHRAPARSSRAGSGVAPARPARSTRGGASPSSDPAPSTSASSGPASAVSGVPCGPERPRAIDPLGNYSMTLEDYAQIWRDIVADGRVVEEWALSAIEQRVIDTGRIPPGFPRELLHHYMFGNYETLHLTPQEFLTKVGPFGSVVDPNLWAGDGSYTEVLAGHIQSRLEAPQATAPGVKTFTERYEFGAFHGAHSTGGLGRFKMAAYVTVEGTGWADWKISGRARPRPDRWDFDWTFYNLGREIWDGGLEQYDDDLRGRERRTALGSAIPGHPFYVNMTGWLKIEQSAGQENATFSV